VPSRRYQDPLAIAVASYGVAPLSVAAAAVAAVSLPLARHAGAARSNSNIATTKFSLSLDRSVISHPGAQIIG